MKLLRLLGSFAVFALAALSQTGCGSAGNSNFPGDIGTYDPDGGYAFVVGDASGPSALDAYVAHGSVQVRLITLSCSGDCATVEAVGTGGHPPYTFEWEDGSTTATRTLCPTSNTNYAVKVTDTGTAGEVMIAPQSAQASVTADVLSCPDGGISGNPEGGLCVSNPSFEGTPKLDVGNDDFLAPPWVSCDMNGADVWNASLAASDGETPALAPTDGMTYAHFLAPAADGPGEAISQPLCGTAHAGTSYSLRVDLASPAAAPLSEPPTLLEIWGGSASCAKTELLWSSPPVSSGWMTYCATLTPTKETTYITFGILLAPDAGSTFGALAVDHVVSVEACP